MTGAKKILCVEDDAFLLSLISGKLIENGATVITATSGSDCLTKAAAEHPDAILLDVMLSDMTGFQILEKLKSDPSTSAIPVIILSNLGGREELENAVALGAASYLIKSNIVPDEIADMVEVEVAKAKQKSADAQQNLPQ